MELKFLLPYWGKEGMSPADFLAQAVQEGWDGVEINIPDDEAFEQELLGGIARIRQSNPGFVFVAQLVPAWPGSMVKELEAYKNGLERLAALKPDFINAHTGRDFYSFEDNCRFIEAAIWVARTGIPIRQETHRGRFSFHAPRIMSYLARFPELELTGDLSHFCTVSESMLEGQEAMLERIFPHIRHLHARIGFEHGPQVNDPRAPEWSRQREAFLGWWDKIVQNRMESGAASFTITPEFGPGPYMPAEPYSQNPLSDQHAVNLWMRDTLRERWAHLSKP